MMNAPWPVIVSSGDADVVRDLRAFNAWLDETHTQPDAHLLTYFARPGAKGGFVLTAVYEVSGKLSLRRLHLAPDQHVPSRSAAQPAFSMFEREMAESVGVPFDDHPWLKPVRFDSERLGTMRDYPFFSVAGKEVHEVAVGPIHAGVIEPGHFRFMCHGELVVHLEIQLGYQHRGVIELCKTKSLPTLTPLIETVAGDTSVAHAWAFAQALETCADASLPGAVSCSRTIALELERVAMHLVGLAGLCTDVGFLPGGATFGRLRTTIINSTMLVCGSRFGHGWVRPGRTRVSLGADTRQALHRNLAAFCGDFETIVDHVMHADTVRRRLEGTGALTPQLAADLGLVGLAARSAGNLVDQRRNRAAAFYRDWGWQPQSRREGDCWARALLRIDEIRQSVAWLKRALNEADDLVAAGHPVGALPADRLVVSVVEGFRGECVHCLETGADGQLVDYRIQDPSLRNWFGLAQAVRGNPIYDFPICNKSFDLSYCGNDL